MKRAIQMMILCSALMVWAENDPLELAVINHDLDRVKQYIDLGIAMDNPNLDQRTPLMLAAQKGFADIADLLLQHGANPMSKDAFGNTVFHFAAEGGTLELMKRLKTLACPLNEKNKYGETPYLAAIGADQVEALRLLESWGCRPEQQNVWQGTPLHYAASQGAVAAIEHLCGQGMAVDSLTEKGQTPLTKAVLGMQVNAVSTLLRLGANPLIKDKTLLTAKSYASYVRNREIYQLVRNRGWQGDAFFEAVRTGKLDQVMHLLPKGKAIEKTNPDGETALFVAATEGQAEILQVLLDHGADGAAMSQYQWTPLYAAAFRGNLACVERLLAKGVNPNQALPGGDTALGAALSRDHLEVAALLAAKGASLPDYMTDIDRTRQIAAPLSELKELRQQALAAGEFEAPQVPFWINQSLEYEPDCARAGEIVVPIITEKATPEYPENASKIRLQGYIILEVILGSDGSISNIKVLKSMGWGHGFEISAMNAVSRFVFIPGSHGGKPANVRMNLRIDFVLA